MTVEAALTAAINTDNDRAEQTRPVAQALIQLRQTTIRAEIAEAAADAAVQWLFFTGTWKDAVDAAAAYELHHGRTVPGLPGRDGWDQ